MIVFAFIAGGMVGALVGVFIMCSVALAKKDDALWEAMAAANRAPHRD